MQPKKRVLVADDDPAQLDHHCDVVASLGHHVVAAPDGDDAYELARRDPPDLVLSDYMMPGRTGVELVRALREHPELSSVPVILMSAIVPPATERAEVSCFLQKPVARERLAHAIGRALAEDAD